MATNQSGIAISLKAFLPLGKTVEEQIAALTTVKTAHETGDYAFLLAAVHDIEVKTEQKTRRIEVAPAAPSTEPPAATQQASEEDAAPEADLREAGTYDPMDADHLSPRS